jgi:GTP-binding protein
MMSINTELAMFDPDLARKSQVVALNKIDLPEVRARLEEERREFNATGIQLHCISAFTGEGVSRLMGEVAGMLEKEAAAPPEAGLAEKVFRPQPKVPGVGIEKTDDGFVLNVPDLERIVVGDDISPSEMRWQLNRQLERLGVIKKLEKAGVKPGDKIRCGSLEWEW